MFEKKPWITLMAFTALGFALTQGILFSRWLEYFEKYGINPVEHESPAKEMQKLCLLYTSRCV